MSLLYNSEEVTKYTGIFNDYYTRYKELLKESRLSGVTSAFDYDKAIYKEDNVFNPNNWNDPILSPLRELLEGIGYSGEYNNGFTTKQIGTIGISHVFNNDTHHFILVDTEEEGGVLYISYYKNRGRTDTIKYLEKVEGIRVYELFELYVKLGLIKR